MKKYFLLLLLFSQNATSFHGCIEEDDLNSWEQDKITWGAVYRAAILSSDVGTNYQGHCYYDGAAIHQELDYQDSAAQCVEDSILVRNGPGGGNCYGSGINKFPKGLVKWMEDNPETTIVTPADVDCLLNGGGAFTNIEQFTGKYCGTCTNMHRELAYWIIVAINTEKLGYPRSPDLPLALEWAANQMWQMHTNEYIDHDRINEDSYHFYQPFMRGLMSGAWIEFVEWEEENNRDPNLLWIDPSDERYDWNTISKALHSQFEKMKHEDVYQEGDGAHAWIGQRIWDEMTKSFGYIDRCIYEETNCTNLPNHPTLNMMTILTPAWLCDREYTLDICNDFDDIFKGSRNWSQGSLGKQFNQQYFHGIKAVEHRQAADENCENGCHTGRNL
jgi:hypothetical protein